MKKLSDYLVEAEVLAGEPRAGDRVSIEIGIDEVVDTYVLESLEDGVIIEYDDTMIQLLEDHGCTFETVKRYGAVGNSPGMGHTLEDNTGLASKAGSLAPVSVMDNNKQHQADVAEGWNDRLADPNAYQDYIDRLRDLADIRRKQDREDSKRPRSEPTSGLDKNKDTNPAPTAEAMGKSSNVETHLRQLAKNGDFDSVYDALTRNDEVGRVLQDMYTEIAQNFRLHPDDDFEPIIDILQDRLELDYGQGLSGVNEGYPSPHNYDSDLDYFDAVERYLRKKGPRPGDDDWESYAPADPIPQRSFKKPNDSVKKSDMDEAKYQGREVPLGKPMAGDVKKSKVYVKGPKGNVVKVNFGDKTMKIKKSNPKRRKSFRARHNCDNPGPRWKARYWSCRAW